MESPQTVESIDLSDEDLLKNVAGIFLFFGVVASIYLFVTISYVTVGVDDYAGVTYFNWAGVIYSLASLISSVALWAFLRVVANISISLKSNH